MHDTETIGSWLMVRNRLLRKQLTFDHLRVQEAENTLADWPCPKMKVTVDCAWNAYSMSSTLH